MYSRRQFTALSAASLTPALWGDTRVSQFASKFNGVQLGVQTYSYRSLRNTSEPWSVAGVNQLMDRVVEAIVQDQINAAEFWIAFIEPPGGPGRTAFDPKLRENLRHWGLSRPLALFERIRRKFNDAGIEIYSAMFNFSDDLTEGEIDVAFEMAKALGANLLSTNCTVRSINGQRRSRKSIKCTCPLTARTRLLIGISTAWCSGIISWMRSSGRRTCGLLWTRAISPLTEAMRLSSCKNTTTKSQTCI